MSESRWFRVNCDWWESDWVYVLSTDARLAWILLLGRVKTHGIGGRLKIASTALLARQWLIGEEGILQILKAAKDNNALVVDGDSWVIVGWSKYQGDESNADRQRRFREQKRLEKEAKEAAKKALEKPPDKPKRNDSNALRNGVTVTETETSTYTPPPNPPSSSHSEPGKDGDGVSLTLQEALDRCWETFPVERKGPNPSVERNAIKACLMASGTSPPVDHYQAVLEGIQRMILHFESRSKEDRAKYIPGFSKFFGAEARWRAEWEAPKQPAGTTNGKIEGVNLYDPGGAVFQVPDDQVEELLETGWARERPKRAASG